MYNRNIIKRSQRIQFLTQFMNKKVMPIGRQGFTLIEMLIVVAIVGLLASVVVLGIGNARERARDAKRAGDIRQIQNGAEAYYATNNAYPADLAAIAGAPALGPGGAADGYGWELLGGGTGYKVGACMETDSFSGSAALCPAEITSRSCAQVLCGGSQ